MDADLISDGVYDPWADHDTQTSEYRAASLKFLTTITGAVTHIVENGSPHVAAWAVAYALGLPVCEGVSLTDRAESLGVSVAALSKQVRLVIKSLDIDQSSYSYDKGH